MPNATQREDGSPLSAAESIEEPTRKVSRQQASRAADRQSDSDSELASTIRRGISQPIVVEQPKSSHAGHMTDAELKLTQLESTLMKLIADMIDDSERERYETRIDAVRKELSKQLGISE
jgi:uncharacterized protein YajQ (UPF0234 family)